jgi:hypothetical protein
VRSGQNLERGQRLRERQRSLLLEHLVRELRERLFQRLDVPAGVILGDDAQHRQRRARGQRGPILRIGLGPLRFVPQQRLLSGLDEPLADVLVERHLHARRDVPDGGRAAIAALLVHAVARTGAIADVRQLGLPQLGDCVLAVAAVQVAHRDVREGQQLVGVQTALEGQRAHAVAMQAEAEVVLAHRLVEHQVSLVHEPGREEGQGEGRLCFEHHAQLRQRLLQVSGVLLGRMAIRSHSLERARQSSERVPHRGRVQDR